MPTHPLSLALTRQRRAALAAGLLLGCLPLTGALANADASVSPALTLQPCRLDGVNAPAQCGTLSRPLNPAQPQGRHVDLQVAVLPALARHKHPDPVVFFAGGPGQSAVDLAAVAQQMLGRLQNRRDLVLIDQRGTGRSAPLYCEGRRPPSAPLADGLAPGALVQRMTACRDRLQALPHGDLRFYTTEIASQDVEAVRQALGAAELNLVGGSYGTRAALDYLRQYPTRVRRVVLDGVAPPDMGLVGTMGRDAEQALDAVLSAGSASYPALRSHWQQLLSSPVREVAVRHPYTGRSETLRLGPDQVAGLVRGALYAPARAAALPATIERAAQGDWAPLLTLADTPTGRGERPGLAEGQHLSVVCSEDPVEGLATPPAGTIAALYQSLYREVCPRWPRAAVSPAFRQIPVSPAPVLLLSGGADPVTPPRHARRVAQALGAQAVSLEVAQAGHGLMGLGCVRDLLGQFINADDGPAALATAQAAQGCGRQLPRPPVYRPLEETVR